ncbi:MAG: hypothetical protein ABIW84_01830 [Ilumatobacteraceae bacterium]
MGDTRLTLCGVLAFPVPTPFLGILPESCKTCAAVERSRPSARAVRPSSDLAALRVLLDMAAVETSRSPRSKHPRRSASDALAEVLAAT